MGEGDASPTGPYQSERGEAKSTTIDATGHTVYNEDGARFTFPSFHFRFPTPLFSEGLEDFQEFARLERDIAAFAIYVCVFRILMKEVI